MDALDGWASLRSCLLNLAIRHMKLQGYSYVQPHLSVDKPQMRHKATSLYITYGLWPICRTVHINVTI